MVAAPSADRWHERSTPLLGGIGIFAGLTVGLWLTVAVGAIPLTKELAGIFGGVALLFAAGLIDDIRALPPLAKLSVQIGAAVLVLATGTDVQLIHTRPIAWALALFWLLGLTTQGAVAIGPRIGHGTAISAAERRCSCVRRSIRSD
jgi:UDP-GlcNAc:undecaprenyl-phosphate GlcNAc-1-phosphate transferase